MLTKAQQLTILEILSPLAPSRIGVFGSVARGENGNESDIDILVAFTKKYSLFDLVEMKQRLSEALSADVDLVTENSLHPEIKPHIYKDLILIKDAQRA